MVETVTGATSILMGKARERSCSCELMRLNRARVKSTIIRRAITGAPGEARLKILWKPHVSQRSPNCDRGSKRQEGES